MLLICLSSCIPTVETVVSQEDACLTEDTCLDPSCCDPTAADPVAMCVQATGGEYPAPILCAGPMTAKGAECVRYGEAVFACSEWQSGPLDMWCCRKD